jgi:general secretion pathway protein G
MLVVVTIIALFISVVGLNYFRPADKARVTFARQQIENFRAALASYKLDIGTFPSTEMGLQSLRVRPANIPRWDGPYLAKDVPVDPWGNAYIYRYPGEHGDEPDIISYGADGQPGGADINADVVSWQ